MSVYEGCRCPPASVGAEAVAGDGVPFLSPGISNISGLLLDFKRDTKKTHKLSSFGRPHGAETEGEVPDRRGDAVAIVHPHGPCEVVPATAPIHPVGAA